VADLEVTPEVLEHVSAEFEAAAQQLRDGLGSLDSEVERMLGANWAGDAASAFDVVWREWHDGSSKVLQGLLSMSDLLKSAARGYSTTDHAGGASIRNSGM